MNKNCDRMRHDVIIYSKQVPFHVVLHCLQFVARLYEFITVLSYPDSYITAIPQGISYIFHLPASLHGYNLLYTVCIRLSLHDLFFLVTPPEYLQPFAILALIIKACPNSHSLQLQKHPIDHFIYWRRDFSALMQLQQGEFINFGNLSFPQATKQNLFEVTLSKGREKSTWILFYLFLHNLFVSTFDNLTFFLQFDLHWLHYNPFTVFDHAFHSPLYPLNSICIFNEDAGEKNWTIVTSCTPYLVTFTASAEQNQFITLSCSVQTWRKKWVHGFWSDN